MEFPLEIQRHIWGIIRLSMYRDRYNRVIRELKHFVEDQRRDKYYISKRDSDNQSTFMYLRFTLYKVLNHESPPLGARQWTNHKSYTLHVWEPYLDKYSRYYEPLRKSTIKLLIYELIMRLQFYFWTIYHYLAGTVFNKAPDIYGYYIDQY